MLQGQICSSGLSTF